MGIFVGCSPFHASNVELILNLRRGHALLQFHVVYDDDFTTVFYLHTATVPPHWPKLVRASSTTSLYTECEVGTWQSLPKLNVDPGDFASDTANVDTASSTTSTQHCEGDDGHSVGASDVVSHHKNTVTKGVTFSDQGQDNEIQSNSPQPDEWWMPGNINLDSSGLRCSTWSTVLGWQDKVYSHSTTSLKKLIRSSTKACLVLLSSFRVIGAGLTCWVHSHQAHEQYSLRLTHTITSFHRVNSMYNGTINCFSILVQSSTAFIETFNYKQTLQKPDYHKFVKAMVNKVDDHESWVIWTLTKPCDLLPVTKTIMNIWSFKRKQCVCVCVEATRL